MPSRNSIVNVGVRLLREIVRAATKPQQRTPSQQGRRRSQEPRASHGYPGDFSGKPQISYAPHPNEIADPGEVVWTWVPYEEDFSQGKDRPVLVIGRDGRWLLVLQVTSQDHDRDAAQEARAGRYWEDIGTGGWDSQGRPSEARVNRIIRIDPSEVRRIGAVLDEQTFTRIVTAVGRHY